MQACPRHARHPPDDMPSVYRRDFYLLILVLLFLGISSARAEATPPQAVAERTEKSSLVSTRPQSTVPSGSERSFLLFPKAHLYPEYIADPRRPNFSAQFMSFSKTEIADTGKQRYGFKFGSRFELLQFHPSGRPDRGWQLGVEAGFLGQFDREHSDDNIGWDGIYGLIASFRASDTRAYKFGLHHVSSHVGDEHAERTGRQRINYTRGELVAGISWSVNDRWRTYSETGWGYDLRNDALQEPWRLQLGWEYVVPTRLWQKRLDWYVAMDLSSTEERDWNIDTTVQTGIAFRRGDRIWRLGIEYYNGRSLIGEFFQDDERYISIGLWLDL